MVMQETSAEDSNSAESPSKVEDRTSSPEKQKAVSIEVEASLEVGSSTDKREIRVKKEEEKAPLDWHDVLKSPAGIAIFSPSLDIANPDSRHGFGLQLATERSKKIGLFGRRVGQLVLDVASLYETFGRSVLKANQLIQPKILALPSPYDDKVENFCEEIRSFSISFRRTAGFYRSKIHTPWQLSLQETRQSIDTSNQQYVRSRDECYKARKNALEARERYVKAVKFSRKAMVAWAIAKKEGEESDEEKVVSSEDDLPWERTVHRLGTDLPRATKRLIESLRDVQKCEKTYAKLVEEENKTVAHAQEVELEALKTFQDVELARIKSFLGIILEPVCDVESQATERVQVTPHAMSSGPNALDDEFNAFAADIEKKGKDLIANLFNKQQNIPYEQGMGVMDAETLGLPNEVGLIRDKVKSNIAAGESATKSIQMLSNFLDEISMAAKTLANGLKWCQSKPQSPSRNGQSESLQLLAQNNVGSRTGKLWLDVMQRYEKEADLFFLLSTSCKSDFKAKLEAQLGAPGSDLKVEDEKDDNNWRQLCDIARAESRAEAKYKQTQLQQEKARERILSTGDDVRERTSTEDNDNKPGKRLMLAGGEAMKKLQEKAKLAMAQKNLNDADQMIAKEKELYDAAVAGKVKRVAEYKAVTETRLKKLEQRNEENLKKISEVLESISKQVTTVQQSRLKNWEDPLTKDDKTQEDLTADTQEWVETTNRTIQKQKQSEDGVTRDGKTVIPALGGYKLSVVLDDAEGIKEILALKGTEDQVTALEIDLEKLSKEEFAEATAIARADNAFGTAAKKALRRSMSGPPQQGEVHANNDVPSSPKKEKSLGERPEMVTFMQEFGFDTPEEAPKIQQVISCTYRPKEKPAFLVPLLHGNLYTTTENLYFLALEGQNFVLNWDRVVSIQKEKALIAANERSIAVTFTTDETQSSFSIGKLEVVDNTLTHLTELWEKSKTKVEPRGSLVAEALPPVPPDSTMKKMEVVLTKIIRNTSIQQFYEKVWSEGNETSAPPFYAPWLEDEGCFEISLEDWEKPGSAEGFVNPWCKESYPQRRYCTFKFKRTSHLYIGPPVAFVKQMQYCRVEKNDKCVLAISASFDGIPYSDTFGVEMRWVARRKGSNDIQIDVGLFVDFKKSTMLKNQIKAGTISETKNVHMRLYEAAKKACSVAGEEDVDVDDSAPVEDEEKMEEQQVEDAPPSNILGMLSGLLSGSPPTKQMVMLGAAAVAMPLAWTFMSYLFGGRGGSASLQAQEIAQLNERISDLQAEVKALKESIDVLVTLVKDR